LRWLRGKTLLKLKKSAAQPRRLFRNRRALQRPPVQASQLANRTDAKSVSMRPEAFPERLVS
jgi:hypothetical protein